MTEAKYDEIAAWYDQSTQAGSLNHALVVPYLLDLIGNVQGQRICDLACGQGILSRQLAQRGAKVVRVDLSTKLLEIARRAEETRPLGITYLQDNAHTLGVLADATFDGVLCNLALMDIPDLDATFQSVYCILPPQGWFVFSITHPCFETPTSNWVTGANGIVKREIRGYFTEGFWRSDNPNGVRGKVGAYHRMLSTYMNALIETGLVLERLLESQAMGEIANRVPEYREVPSALIARCRKR